jgi:cyclopropane fatty-acyl-phospholipid synthase-like methyltransferase
MFRRLLRKFQRNPDAELPKPEPGVNKYGRQLTASQIAAKEHRAFVGGLWEQIGQLQFQFMTAQGLLPQHKLVDVGCGAMRGGVHFVNYLNKGNYFGVDSNRSLIEAAKIELDEKGLSAKSPSLLVNHKFELSLFNTTFDYAIAISVFTHLYMNHITRCLVEIGSVLTPNGRFYATFFQAPRPAHLKPMIHYPGKIKTYYDHDPFHCSLEEMQSLAAIAHLEVNLVQDWTHPRAQKMLCFTKPAK